MKSKLLKHAYRRRINELDRWFIIRNILNTIFIIGAIIGVALHFTLSGNLIGDYVILASMVFKFAECILRYLHK